MIRLYDPVADVIVECETESQARIYAAKYDVKLQIIDDNE